METQALTLVSTLPYLEQRENDPDSIKQITYAAMLSPEFLIPAMHGSPFQPNFDAV